LAIAAVAYAYKPTVIRAGNLVLTFNGGISPTRLPKREMAPVSLNVSGKIASSDGTHVPALKEFVLETDRNGGINAKGIPTCTANKLEARTTKDAERVCPDAIVGEGTTNVEVAFAEQKPIPISSKLLLFNGGVSGGVTTLYVHAFLTNPVSAAIVTTVKVTKVHNGRYGIKSVASVPKIAGGSGSVTSFTLKVGRRFTYKGKPQSFLVAKCPDGHLDARGEAVFTEGTRVKGSVTRPCTPKS
jgi:hypothetical protein